MHKCTLPPATGIGLKAQHYQALLDTPNAIAWLEIHPENYMGAGGPPHRYLSALKERYPLSMHGVGMSLGSVDGVNTEHLQRLQQLVQRYEPESISEHVSWSHWNSIYLNDLLPLPYTQESLKVICNNIDKVQNTLGRRILIENPSTYIAFNSNEFSEPDFFSEIVKQCDCGLLLDINNVFVSASNNTFDPYEYINAFPLQHINEIHLAGHSVQQLSNGKDIRIDDHGSEVNDDVWQLFEHFLKLTQRAIPTLIEWDTHVPALSTLLAQANKAEKFIHHAITEKKARGAL